MRKLLLWTPTSLPLLRHLILNAFFCRLPFQSCLPIAKALKDNKTLLRLDLSHNPLTVAGLSSLFESLKYNTTIEWMNLQATGTFTKVSERSFSSHLFRFDSSGLVSVAPIFHSSFIFFRVNSLPNFDQKNWTKTREWCGERSTLSRPNFTRLLLAVQVLKSTTMSWTEQWQAPILVAP